MVKAYGSAWSPPASAAPVTVSVKLDPVTADEDSVPAVGDVVSADSDPATLIQQQVLSLLNWGRGGAMGVILLVATFGLLGLASPFMKRRYQMSGGSR